MRIFNVRFGLATNSSSSHSLIFLPENVQAEDHCGYSDDQPSEFGDFGWQRFTAASTGAKMRYLAAMLKERLYHELPQNIADTVIRSWLPDVVFDPEDGIDHQSFMFLPSAHGTEVPDEQFFNELKDYFLQDRLAVLGGNDNEQAIHHLDDGSSFHLPIPRDTGIHYSDYTCRFDEKYNFWTIFCKKEGTKVRFRFDRQPNEMEVAVEKSSTPELVDLKITDYCPFDCSYCYQGSTEDGEHVSQYSLSRLAEELHHLKVFEVAIGGGEPTLHPDFPSILESFHNYGMVTNFTTKNIQWLRKPDIAKRIIDACGSFGFSAVDCNQVKELRTLLDYNNFDIKPNIHVVLGVIDAWELSQMLKATNECGFNTTILSYKQTGRGEDFQPKRIGDWISAVKRASEGRNYGCNIGIDTPLAAEHEEGLRNQNVDPRLYETREGQFSCYIDAVTQKMGPSSYCKPEEMVSIKGPVWGEGDQREICEKIRDGFASF